METIALVCIENGKNVFCHTAIDCARADKCLKHNIRWSEERAYIQAKVPHANHEDSIGE